MGRTPKNAAESSARNEIPVRLPNRPGNSLPLDSLAPRYHADHHEVYLDLLERALRHPSTLNIALTGSYGSGKSSVLHELGRSRRKGRVIELSLSTLDPQLVAERQPTDEVEAETSNRIQKELVKQILYQLAPWKTPHSRFRRASKPAKRTGLYVGVATALFVLMLYVVSVLAGWHENLVRLVEEADWNTPLFWVAVSASPVLIAILVWSVIAGRVTFKAGVNASALSVSLEPTSSTYFDQYLDEIMYFFQVSRCEIVLIEDVDRFNDPAVFDTLRGLNALINNSGQVNRRVVFIYAIRDSVLNKLEDKTVVINEVNDEHPASPAADGSHLDDSDERANRAKFFDVIIPIVPFVNTHNARDLMMQVMGSHVAGPTHPEGISPALIRLVARHIADMRTIRSLRNEYEVHRDRLITSAIAPMPDITEDIVFSLVLLRATSPKTYEDIRLSTSPLDTLVRRWSVLVETHLRRLTEEITDLRTQLEDGKARESRAKQAGARLLTLKSRLLSYPVGFTGATVKFHGPLKDEDLENPGGWKRIAEGQALMVDIAEREGYSRNILRLQLHKDSLESLLGLSIDPKAWQQADLESLEDEIKEKEAEIRFLRHHTWAELYKREDLVIETEAQERAPGREAEEDGQSKTSVSFRDLVNIYAPTQLARELLEHGYLPRYFARYSSMFYGAVVSLNATEYISRAIEPGDPMLEYELDETDIAQILLEQDATSDDADLFGDQSVYNLDIVSYLLLARPGAAERVARQLSMKWEELEQRFVTRFFQRQPKSLSSKLAASMAPSWQQALSFIVLELNLTEDRRLELADSILGSLRSLDEREDLVPQIGAYLSQNYSKLESVVSPKNQEQARKVMEVIALSEGTIRDLTVLDETALKAATEVSAYPVTAMNLEALGEGEDLALDVIRNDPEREAIYKHFVDNFEEYLDALSLFTPRLEPIWNADNFAPLLDDIAQSISAEMLDRLVAEAHIDCHIAELENVTSVAWPALIKHDVTDPTLTNVTSYIREYGFDQNLSYFLSFHENISEVEDTTDSDRLQLALQILHAGGMIPEPATRVSLASSLQPGLIPIAEITSDDADLVSYLIQADLLPDAPETFRSGVLTRWEDFEAAVASSKMLPKFIDPDVLPFKFVLPILKSSHISDKTKMSVLSKLSELLPDEPHSRTNDLVREIISREARVDTQCILALQRAGAKNHLLVELIVLQGEDLPLSELREVLTAMDGDYGRLSEGGSGVVRFDVHSQHTKLLERLEDITHTGGETKTTKQHGTKIQANLKQP